MLKKLNKKGFTLIELLAVIVILSLLVAVSVPAVSRYLNSARKGIYAVDAKTAIGAVRDEVQYQGITTAKKYKLADINKLLETPLEESPYGISYLDNSYIEVTFSEDGKASYSICLVDVQGNGFYDASTKAVKLSSIDEDSVKTGLEGVSCE